MRLIYIFAFLLICSSGISQLIVSQQVFSSGGLSAGSPAVSINSTFGETFIFGNSNLSLSYDQGFNSGIINQTVKTIMMDDKSCRISYYPNPTREFLNLNWDNKLKIISIRIQDIQGNFISENQIDKTSEITIRLPVMSSGIYSIHFTSEEGLSIMAGLFIYHN